jgi:hypothetical protein
MTPGQSPWLRPAALLAFILLVKSRARHPDFPFDLPKASSLWPHGGDRSLKSRFALRPNSPLPCLSALFSNP